MLSDNEIRILEGAYTDLQITLQTASINCGRVVDILRKEIVEIYKREHENE